MKTFPIELFFEIEKFFVSSDIQILRNVNKFFYNIFKPHFLHKSYLVQYTNLSIEKWLNDNNLYFINKYKDIAYGGHLEIIQNQFLNNYTTINPQQETIIIYATKGGHLDILIWFHTIGFVFEDLISKVLYDISAKKGHLHILKWLRSLQPPCTWKQNICCAAAEGGHLDILIWLKQEGCNINICTANTAAQNGQINILKWLKQQDCPMDEWTCSWAAQNGHFETLCWLKENGCNWDTVTCSNAVLGGHLEILKWARAQNPPCPWDEWTCNMAVRKGNLEILDWAIYNGCPFNYQSLCKIAKENENQVIINYLMEREDFIKQDFIKQELQSQ
jgi:hypothetical protein